MSDKAMFNGGLLSAALVTNAASSAIPTAPPVDSGHFLPVQVVHLDPATIAALQHEGALVPQPVYRVGHWRQFVFSWP